MPQEKIEVGYQVIGGTIEAAEKGGFRVTRAG